MGLKRVWVVVVMLVLLKGWWYTSGCWEQEKIALLQLKHFFNNSVYLRDWVEGEESVDCCLWERVECNATTSRVIHLYLNYTRDWRSTKWYLNASLFLPFEKLKTLSLQDNTIAGWVENEVFERLSSRLSNLRALDLSDNSFNDNIFSSLSRFSSLKSLYLAGNNFTGSFLNNGVERLLRLINLELLDLSSNPFNNSVLSFLGRLPSLKSLYICYNKLNGFIQIKEALCNLEKLDISGNEVEKFVVSKDERCLSKLKVLYLDDINTNKSILLQSMGSLPSLKTLTLRGSLTYENLDEEGLFLDASSLQINFLQSLGALTSLKNLFLRDSEINGTLTAQDLPNFKNLERLSMGGTTLNNSFLQTIGEMNFLKTLELYDCGLNGTLPTQGLCELIRLQKLDISLNNLGGNLPDCLANLTSLQSLDLSNNQFTGNLSPLQSLTSIKYISILNNRFQIPISLGPFFNHSKLKDFYGDNNKIHAETESHSLSPKFQLNTISLVGYGYGGAIPKFLYHQHDLQFVDISHIHFEGEFPNWLLENNTRLSELHLVNNSLSGPFHFHLPVHSHMGLQQLDMSNNFFCGQIPTDIGAYFPWLETLDMSMNAFNDSIPPSFGDMKSLDSLDLSNNLLSGEIPEHLVMGCFSLSYLALSNNNLQGQIFSTKFNLTNLSVLYLDGNNFTGWIPTSLSNFSNMIILDISNNHLEGTIPQLTGAFDNSSSLIAVDLSNNHITGSIPDWIDKLSRLNVLLLNNNDLEGEIPIQLCHLDKLSLIDLSHNQFFGRIPHCLQITTSSEVVGGEAIEFTTKSISYSYQDAILSDMAGMDLSCNKLIGEIPYEIGNLSDLRVLNLSYNNLSGLIPSTFGNLRQIESLDLSNNNLSGKIPQELVDLNFLEVFSVAHNNLSGEIPETAQFATFEKSSYEANPLLCGKPLPNSCSVTGSPSPRASIDSGEDSGFIDMEIFYVSFTVTYVIVLLAIAAVLYINPYWRRVWFYHIEILFTSCYYFVVDNLPRRFCHGNM